METFKLSTCKEILTEKDFQLVKMADEYGYKAIAVSVYDETVEASHYWSKQNVEFLTGEPDPRSKMKGRYSGSWPAVWEIGNKMDISAGCGNSQQRQLIRDHGLTKASYRKVKGEWKVCENVLNHVEKQTKLEMGSTTEEHLENVKIIINQMRSVQNLIVENQKEEAFNKIMERLSRWSQVVKNAHHHLKLSLPEKEESILAPSHLRFLKDLLEKNRTYEKFNV
jgi:hypothetical protein